MQGITVRLFSSGSASGSGCKYIKQAGRRALSVSHKAPTLPPVAVAGAPPNFSAPPAAIPTAADVLPQDVLAAAAYMKAVKQLKGVWQTLAEFARFVTRQVSDGLNFADCYSLTCAGATGGAIVTVQEESQITCNHFKAVAAQSTFVYS